MRLFVLGTEGQVARSLREASTRSRITLGFGFRPDVDLLHPESIANAIRCFRPDVVINPAAYTAVDKAEAEPQVAFAINRDGARAAAAAAHELNVPIIHLSTDYVFDGKKDSPYSEADAVNPQGVYGRSKLEGEEAVATANPRHVILRTSWVYAPFGQNFVRTMLRIGAERDHVRVVNDQMGCPTYALDLATAILEIAQKMQEWRQDFVGVTHIAGTEAMTWYEFACHIFEWSKQRGGPSPIVEPILTSAYPTAAVRPANSRLSTDRLKNVFGIDLPPTNTSLAHCLDRLFAERGN
ncbi:dTDP-4-dehydrorhamnose reductase [Bradyrhizobium sp. STM 3562]|uniref:dTDP-4-dehydrorhamnose reductase n=1 Tax=Bradyrhizobium sp. STM 3562 TaxID=578924 RepID=UPI00388F1800